MKRSVLAVISVLALGSYVYAKEEAPVSKKAVTTQDQKMKDCNEDASSKGLKGVERKQYLQECLGHKPAAKSTAKNKK